MRILMVGAGATGSYFGARLALAGRDVTFLARGHRLEQLRTSGIDLRGPRGDAQLPTPATITRDDLETAAPFDLVIVSTKSYSLASAMDDFAPAVGPDTAVLPILNGMAQLDTLAARFGPQRVLGGSVRILADMAEDGTVSQMGNLAELNFGEVSGERTPRDQAILDQLTAPGITTALSENILATMWNKWWILATMGAVGVISGGTVGEMSAAPYGAETAAAILQESVAIAAANGYPADPAAIAQNTARMTEAGSAITSSMFRDMLKGHPVEADHILGDLLARARGVAAPLLKAAYVRLKVYEATRTA